MIPPADGLKRRRYSLSLNPSDFPCSLDPGNHFLAEAAHQFLVQPELKTKDELVDAPVLRSSSKFGAAHRSGVPMSASGELVRPSALTLNIGAIAPSMRSSVRG